MQSDNPGNVVRLAMDAGGLRVDRVEHDSAVVYRVAGELDTLTAPHLDLAISDGDQHADEHAGEHPGRHPAGVSRVILDLTEVQFLGSAGLSILVEHHASCQRDGIGFGVVAPRHAVRRALEITALDQVIPLYDTVSDALRADG